MLSNIKSYLPNLKLYYCIKCGFARVFWAGPPKESPCPACGGVKYEESVFNDDSQNETQTLVDSAEK